MVVRQTDSTHFQAIEEAPTQLQFMKKEVPTPTLHQVFNNDTSGTLSNKALAETIESESKTPSFWSKIFAWWYQPEIKIQSAHTSSSHTDLLEINELEPISPIPALDEPETSIDFTLAKLPHTSKKTNQKDKLSQKELVEGLSLMSDRTIEQIMFIILKAQMELEKENANVEEKTFSNYQSFKKFQEKYLQEVKDILIKDEKIAGYFNTSQKIAVAASFICGIAGAAVSFGALAPAGAFIGASIGGSIGAAAGGAFVTIGTLLGGVGPVVTSAVTAFTTGSNAFFQWRLNEDKAKHEQVNHKDKYYMGLADESRERLMSIAESDNVFKEQMIQLIKRFQTMGKLVLKR